MAAWRQAIKRRSGPGQVAHRFDSLSHPSTAPGSISSRASFPNSPLRPAPHPRRIQTGTQVTVAVVVGSETVKVLTHSKIPVLVHRSGSYGGVAATLATWSHRGAVVGIVPSELTAYVVLKRAFAIDGR